MKYETIHNLILPKIGFGTWKIGGESSPNPKMDLHFIEPLCVPRWNSVTPTLTPLKLIVEVVPKN